MLAPRIELCYRLSPAHRISCPDGYRLGKTYSLIATIPTPSLWARCSQVSLRCTLENISYAQLPHFTTENRHQSTAKFERKCLSSGI